MRRWAAWCAVMALLGCANTQPGATPEDARANGVESNLVTSLEVEVGGDTVRFVLHATNSGTQPLVLEFSTSARYDFEVFTPTNELVWRWSADQMFAQVLGADTVPAGSSLRYIGEWAPENRSGSLVAVGRVLATNHEIEQRTSFELPTR